MRGPTPARLHKYCCRRLRLEGFLRDPGDGRTYPQIPAAALLWGLLLGKVLRVPSHHGVEFLARMARAALLLPLTFIDDTLAYFTRRLAPTPLRDALAGVCRRAKRNKAFQQSARTGLALDGTGSGRSAQAGCELCHQQGGGYGHKFAAISVVGAGLDLPFDIEAFAPGDCELNTSKRLLKRGVTALGRRFADYVVVDSLYANAPFLHLCDELGLPVITSLKANLPELFEAAQARFRDQEPHGSFAYQRGEVEFWEADDFEPWLGLKWPAVRVLRFRYRRADGQLFDGYWLTSFSPRRVGARALFDLCKSRWAIENHGFNDAKNRYGLQHIPHHHANAILINALLTFLGMCIERLCRLRYLRRGTHPPYTSIQFNRLLWLALGRPEAYDTS